MKHFLLILLLFTPISWAKEPRLIYWNDGSCEFEGNITKKSLRGFTKMAQKKCTQLYLNSSGGDVETAIKMGRLIRDNEIVVVIPEKSVCASACALMFAGGVMRLPYATIQIHRPYLESSDASFSQTQKTYREIELQVKNYLRDMNASETLFDDMMKIPPHESRHLGLTELENYGIGVHDAVYFEYTENRNASESGLSKSEWLHLTKSAEQLCGKFNSSRSNDALKKFRPCWQSNFLNKLPKIPENYKNWDR